MTTTKKNRITAILVSVCAVIALLAGATCVMAAKLQITDIDIPAQISLEQGDAEAIEVAYTVEGDLPENILQRAAKTASLYWISSDTSVATVDKCGKVTAVGPGTAEISVTGQNGALSDSCSVTVTVTPETLTTPDEFSLTLSYVNVQNLGAALLPENTTAKVCYESSDENIATVTATGEVTAIGRGECIIRAWAVDALTGATYDLQSETKVSVQAAPAKLSLSNATLQSGATKHLTVSTEPAELGQSASCTVTVAKPYNGFVKGEPGVSESFLRSTNAYYLMTPANVRSHFESNGGTAIVAATSLGPRWGYGNNISALLDHASITIWIDYRNISQSSVLHEMGHYVDLALGYITNSYEFATIYASEAPAFRSVWDCSSENTASTCEYFAEAFEVCIKNPGLMQKYCPQTYTFIMDCARSL